MSSINYVADLNDLVREAYDAQEAFDMWDEGKTVGGFVVAGRRTSRECDLATVAKEWDEANLKLVMFVASNAAPLIAQILADAGEREKDHG